MIEDINGFSNIIFVDGRSFDNLKLRMIEATQAPAQIITMGLKPNGFPYAILKVSVLQKPKVAKKSEPGQDAIITTPEQA